MSFSKVLVCATVAAAAALSAADSPVTVYNATINRDRIQGSWIEKDVCSMPR